MLLERLYDAAAPHLESKRVREVRMGCALVGVVLDSGEFGAAYALPGERAEAEPAFPDPERYVGRDARTLAAGLRSGNLVERALGMAACNAVAVPDPARCLEDPDAVATVAVGPNDTVGLIGFIRSVYRRVEGVAARIVVFDRSLDGEPGIYPEERQPELLPQCDLVFVTGSAVTNGTLERLLPWCARAREVVVIGPSTPLYPEAFAGTGVTVLAGATWPPEHQREALAMIGQGHGFHSMGYLTHRWAMRVN